LSNRYETQDIVNELRVQKNLNEPRPAAAATSTTNGATPEQYMYFYITLKSFPKQFSQATITMTITVLPSTDKGSPRRLVETYKFTPKTLFYGWADGIACKDLKNYLTKDDAMVFRLDMEVACDRNTPGTPANTTVVGPPANISNGGNKRNNNNNNGSECSHDSHEHCPSCQAATSSSSTMVDDGSDSLTPPPATDDNGVSNALVPSMLKCGLNCKYRKINSVKRRKKSDD
jgi:hypothetical protein